MRVARRVDFEMLPKWAQQWDFWEIIEKKCTMHEIDPYHIGALIKTESNGNHLACRYEPNFKWTFEIEEFASQLNASEATIECLQQMSIGLCQVMGTLFFELGGMLEPIEQYRWPTCMFDKRISIEYGCRAWNAKTKYYCTPEEKYSAYNAGSVRYSIEDPSVFINQSAVNIFKKNLDNLTENVRY